MKRYILIFTVAAMTAMASCAGFLDEMDQDKFVPTTADHYAALLLREFNSNPGLFGNVQLMTDEVAETPYKIKLSTTRTNMKPLYAWQKDIERLEDGTRAFNNPAWNYMYRQIAIANYVIEQIDGAKGSPEEIAFTKGEAYFIRAYCYLCLANLYAEPYRTPEQARVTYGVPLRTDIGVVPTYDKAMLNEGYDLILSDLSAARSLISGSGITKSLYHPSVKACDLLLSRVRLYMKDYDAAIAAATEVINGSYLSKLTAGSQSQPFITKNNPEVIYSLSLSSVGPVQTFFSGSGLVVNDQLLKSYHDSDQRRQTFFTYYADPNTSEVSVYPRKNESTYTELGRANFRVAEAYLNRAEAYALTGQAERARADLHTLLSNRYLDPAQIDIPAGDTELAAYIMQERLRELCFEEHHRWFDLRRMDPQMRPEIVHQFSIVDGDSKVLGIETYTLLRNDPNYTLSVPYQEKANNPLIRDYERFDKLPEYQQGSIF